RIDSSRIGRSLLSRTIRQVVAASYAEEIDNGEAVMEVQGVRVSANISNRLAANMHSLSELCRKALVRIKPLAQSKGVQLYNEIEKGPFRILGDSKHLTNILLILLENAVKHTDPDGAVGLELAGESEHETLHLTIWDTGKGIEPDQIINFYKADWLSNDVDRERNLRYVQKYTQLHEGLLSIQSDVGRGTRVTISLPWSSAVQLSNGQMWRSSFKRQIRILLVEDDDQYIETISNYLQAKNFEVVIARNGKEGIKQVTDTRPDLVLMDMEMPIMDGFEAIKQIRGMADLELAQLPIIAFTALNLSRDKHNGMTAGANDYITKPVSLRWLSQSITSQLEKIHLIETISS
ncbi:MAG: response regulator, partial [Chloroflexota bacterium]